MPVAVDSMIRAMTSSPKFHGVRVGIMIIKGFGSTYRSAVSIFDDGADEDCSAWVFNP